MPICGRIAGEPIARILGNKEFWGLSLRLSADTLVPRPDTETIVEAALEQIDAEHRREAPLRIADLGTGSGAILLALLSELWSATGIGTDINFEALQTARANAAQLGFADRASFVACDYASALRPGFDLIVSNPPYIPAAAIATLADEVRLHDPSAALDGGLDGLDAYRRILAEIAAGPVGLATGGSLMFEVGHDQADAVLAIGRNLGFAEGRVTHDLSGHARVVAFNES